MLDATPSWDSATKCPVLISAAEFGQSPGATLVGPTTSRPRLSGALAVEFSNGRVMMTAACASAGRKAKNSPKQVLHTKRPQRPRTRRRG